MDTPTHSSLYPIKRLAPVVLPAMPTDRPPDVISRAQGY